MNTFFFIALASAGVFAALSLTCAYWLYMVFPVTRIRSGETLSQVEAWWVAFLAFENFVATFGLIYIHLGWELFSWGGPSTAVRIPFERAARQVGSFLRIFRAELLGPLWTASLLTGCSNAIAPIFPGIDFGFGNNVRGAAAVATCAYSVIGVLRTRVAVRR